MAYIETRGSTRLNPSHIVSVDLQTETKTYIENEYRDNAKFHHISSYRIIIKMVNGDTYEEVYNDYSAAAKRRDNLQLNW